MTDLDLENFKRDLLVASDVRSLIELLQRTFDEERLERGLTKSELANSTGRGLPYVSRILSGRQKNVTLRTLALFMRAMGRRIEPSATRITEIEAHGSNYRILAAVYDWPPVRSDVFSSGQNVEVSDENIKRSHTYSLSTPAFSITP